MSSVTKREKNNAPHRLHFFGLGRILPYLAPYRVQAAVMIVLGMIASMCDSLYPLFNRYALNHFIAEKTLDTLHLFILLYVVILLVQLALNFISSYLICLTELYIGRDLKNASFGHLQTLSFSYFNTHNVGYIHARIMSDTDRIATTVSWRIMDIVWNVSYIGFMFGVMALIDFRLALRLLLLIPAAVLLVALFQKKLVLLHRRVREINAKISANFNEGITGARSIRTLVVENTILRDFKRDTRDMRQSSVLTTHWSALFTSAITLMSSLALALVLWQGGSLTKQGLMQIGTLSIFMTYALNMIEPIQYIVQALSSMIDVQVNIERFAGLMDTRSDVNDTPEVIEKYGDNFSPRRENWEELSGDIEFRDVSFRYPDGEEMVLEHFYLHVPQGTSVAIVGETGAGKSTLVNLVCRFFEPTKGQILIDGRDARERSQLWLHSHIGYVLQTPHLFSGTVRSNLLYGRPDATDEEIWEAIRIVDAEDVITRMGHGLDSEVGEGGELLSTGEKQLLSYARAVLADPAILILDEATSSIDTVTEQKIQHSIERIIKGRTSFMIAHRLSTIINADIILAVVDGKIVESGTHSELMAKKGYYFRLFTKQYEDAETQKVW
ncbi:ABC transporter ATP-binding protein [Lachnoclostridium sp. Marseille-P6806]|uniref:ABC transporter ATP-binding protein n=1 Tax=Lachnoclostridium sp. Marseille-P6806 TaxID=2364793 RepID=UPI001031DCA7|nr:ABC transporter ATP-binding protein [Lachnoclostridium sp. Marseille-P6806]